MAFWDTTPATTTQQQTSTTTANPWATAQPLLTNLTGGYGGINTAVTPEQQQAAQTLWGGATATPNMAPIESSAVQSIFANAGMAPSVYGQTQANLSPIAGMNLDPYKTPGFSDALNTLTNNITNTVKGQYAGSGRAPSGAGSFAGSLSRGLMQGEAPILQSQYNANIGNVLSAQQMLQNAGINTEQAMSGNTMAALQAAGILPSVAMAPGTAQMGAANQIYGQPIQNLNQVLTPAMGLGGMGGTTQGTGYTVGTQTPANNPLSNILGGISGIAGLAGAFGLSDRRLKTDIKDIGRTHDDQKIYSYRFKGSNMPQIGMMADEVEKKTPDAVMSDPSGFKRVHYDRATRKAAQMGMLRAA